eukprot:TRINITY_DN5880_c0_g1_i1.p1 TRINITY_DN5880_c0_g1~~TRINITY_DN5880_c0_g1_i1.p1  ORF type:complete len:288 (-),score=64.16 TRINITY_DN5880_c0_g1_i1:299-1120(-)
MEPEHTGIVKDSDGEGERTGIVKDSNGEVEQTGIVKDSNGEVLSVSLDGLISEIINHTTLSHTTSSGSSIQEELLMTYRGLCTSEKFVETVLKQFWSIATREVPAVRCINLLRLWLDQNVNLLIREHRQGSSTFGMIKKFIQKASFEFPKLGPPLNILTRRLEACGDGKSQVDGDSLQGLLFFPSVLFEKSRVVPNISSPPLLSLPLLLSSLPTPPSTFPLPSSHPPSSIVILVNSNPLSTLVTRAPLFSTTWQDPGRTLPLPPTIPLSPSLQ